MSFRRNNELEQERKLKDEEKQYDFFDSTAGEHTVILKLKELDIDSMTPLEALKKLSELKGDIHIREGTTYTNLILADHKDLKKEYGHFKGHVILYATEKGADLFDEKRRHYVKLSFNDDSHNVQMELIDDPFYL